MEKIGRLGWLGLAIEATSGSAEATPDVFIPFIENSMRGHHEPLMDNSARASRVKDFNSVEGKKWGEGSVNMYLDSSNCGYLLKMALGSEVRTEKNTTPPVHDHALYPTVSGNAVVSATLWNYQGVDVEQFTNSAVDVCEIEVNNEGIATMSASIMSKFPTTVSAPNLTTASGTVFTWKDMIAQFGSTVQGALAASATKLTNFKLTISNSVALHYKSGSSSPDSITSGALEVTGSYTLYFDTATDRDKYYALNKQSLIISMTGAGLGVGGYSERLQIVLKKVMIEDVEIETGLDDFYAITCNFRAEIDNSQAGYVEMTLRNGKSTDYA